LYNFADYIVFSLILIAQSDMARRYVRARAAGGRARYHVAAVALVLAAGVVLRSSELVSNLNLPARPVTWFTGAVHLWLFGSSAGWSLYRAFRLVFGPHTTRPEFNPERRRLLHSTGGALAATPFAFLGYGAFVERTDFRVREADVPVPDLPHDLEGLRLLQLSDIHLSAFLSERELARVIDAANETRPHLAVVTGDLITSKGDPLDACLNQLARLRSDAGTLGCLGNHEVYAGAESYATAGGARRGIRFLRNQAATLRFGGAALHLAGVDYQRMSHQAHYLDGTERLVRPGSLNILLSHNPDVFPAAAKKGYNLVLSGHTHGGQVTVEILDQSLNAARFFTPYVYGLYRQGAAAAYVTRGIGTIGIPARIGAPPEISLLRLRKA